MKLYDLVKYLLIHDEPLRSNDKALMWKVWERENHTTYNSISHIDFMKSTSPESIRRTRQMIQARHPELKATDDTQARRAEIAKERGAFVFRAIV